MPISLSIALRYLFGKKSTNAINIITAVSVIGIAIGTAALILILSVFNGFEGLMKGYLDTFNPDLKIELTEGKFFYKDEPWIKEMAQIEGISKLSMTIEEVALLEYGDKQQVGIIKGVDEYFIETVPLKEAMRSGDIQFEDTEFGTYCIIGNGVSNLLNVNLQNRFTPLTIHVPNRKKKIIDKDFKSRPLLVSGVFSIRNERDNQYVLSSYEMVSGLLDLYDKISAVEIKLHPDADQDDVIQRIEELLNDKYEVSNRYQQDESFLKAMSIEKWSSYLIFGFTLILIIFNVIGSLWMIVIDKKKDLSVLQSFGADKALIKRIFYWEGGLISFLGFGIGFVIAIIFYILQKNVGLITVPDGFAATSYPIELLWTDVFIIFLTVIILGFCASIPTSIRAARVSSYVRTE